jgi:hypothetical protein
MTIQKETQLSLLRSDGGYESENAVREIIDEGYLFELEYLTDDGDQKIRLVGHTGSDSNENHPDQLTTVCCDLVHRNSSIGLAERPLTAIDIASVDDEHLKHIDSSIADEEATIDLIQLGRLAEPPRNRSLAEFG